VSEAFSASSLFRKKRKKRIISDQSPLMKKYLAIFLKKLFLWLARSFAGASEGFNEKHLFKL
jgi:hypothetical protein